MKKKTKKKMLKRNDRLEVGKKWIETYEGTNFIRGYRKKFKVNTICALKELEILGVKLDSGQEELFESDETFSFIAGYTSGGAPFGTRWDEEELDTNHIYIDDIYTDELYLESTAKEYTEEEYAAAAKEFEDDEKREFTDGENTYEDFDDDDILPF